MIIVSEKESWHLSDAGASSIRTANKIAWQLHENSKMILAVGDPEDLETSLPLPAGAVVTDIVQISSDDPALASELWGAFLAYVYYQAKPGPWQRFVCYFSGIRVRLSIDDRNVRAAVGKAIGRCKTYRVSVAED